MDKIEKKEESEQTILLNNYNYALNEEFDYLDKEEESENSSPGVSISSDNDN
jgi:hypothetical protein